jgi:NTP pyrophosphatase (non-canonical NTP hydrolase)
MQIKKINNIMQLTNEFSTIRYWAEERGIYQKGDSKTQALKVVDEMGELARGVIADNKEEIKDGIGDVIVSITNLAHLCGLTVEDCINSAYQEIKDRKGKMIGSNFVKDQS